MGSILKKWLMATRPSSLWITFCPIAMGTAMAAGDGIAHLQTALVALIGGVLIHIGTNLTNDYGDFRRGVDQTGEIDPMREIPVGAIKPERLLFAIVLVFLLALFPCIYLIARGGMPIVIIAVCSILVGILYTAGPKPLGYLGLGDVLVLIFFGPVAVAGTYYVQSFEINTAVILAGFSPGLFALGVLTINNIRDIEKDRNADKKTLVVRFGRRFGEWEYFVAVTLACIMPLFVHILTKNYTHSTLAALVVFLSYPVIKNVLTTDRYDVFNKSIGMTVQLLLIYTLIFSIGWMMV